jgi:hypothetical protein
MSGVELNKDGVLSCPTCTEDLLHHGKVIIQNRYGQDEDGVEFCVQGTSIVSEKISSKQIHNRRDNIYIYLTCEMCHGPSDEGYCLSIVQHKGKTYLRWVKSH